MTSQIFSLENLLILSFAFDPSSCLRFSSAINLASFIQIVYNQKEVSRNPLYPSVIISEGLPHNQMQSLAILLPLLLL